MPDELSNVLVSYLALYQPPEIPRLVSRPDAEFVRLKLDIASYLDLYSAVGGPWGWDQRCRMPRSELATFLAGPHSIIYGACDRHSRQTLGFCEFDASQRHEVQLMNFGLVPDAFGRGLGSWLLRLATAAVYADVCPSRIWLHTDTKDHPKARQTYLEAGFVLEAEKWEALDGL